MRRAGAALRARLWRSNAGPCGGRAGWGRLVCVGACTPWGARRHRPGATKSAAKGGGAGFLGEGASGVMAAAGRAGPKGTSRMRRRLHGARTVKVMEPVALVSVLVLSTDLPDRDLLSDLRGSGSSGCLVNSSLEARVRGSRGTCVSPRWSSNEPRSLSRTCGAPTSTGGE